MSKRKGKDIHDVIKQKFGVNKLYDEQFSEKGYWDWLESKAQHQTAHGAGTVELREPVQANADNASEEDGIGYRKESPEYALMLQVISESLPLLSEQQRRALYYCGEMELSYAEAAKVMKISKGTVQFYLEEARAKITRLFTLRKAELDL